MWLEQLTNSTIILFCLQSVVTAALVIGIVVLRKKLKEKSDLIEELRLWNLREKGFRAIKGGADAA